MDKMMKVVLGMLLEVDTDGMKKIAAKEFINFLKSDEVPFEEKASQLFRLDMDDVINHLDDKDIEILNEELQKLHKCVDRFFNKLENKTA